jgi:RNA polymerase sigma factor (sigma-70 family)
LRAAKQSRRDRLDENDLIDRARLGNADAYEQLVRHYQELAFRVAYVITGSASDAEESAQDAFVKAYFALGRFRPGSPFRPWLLRIVANEARNRRVAAVRRFALVPNEATVDPAGDDGTPESVVLDRERARRLIDCLNALRPDDRQILTYRFLLELSEAETADALGIARGTVKSRLSRALGRARAVLEANRIDHD